MKTKKIIVVSLTILFLSIFGSVIYVYIIPWSAGTFVADKCTETCKNGSYCCKDPREGGSYCMSKPCRDIRLDLPSENKVRLFTYYIVTVVVLLLIVLIEIIMLKLWDNFYYTK
jgi:hypothetical protein